MGRRRSRRFAQLYAAADDSAGGGGGGLEKNQEEAMRGERDEQEEERQVEAPPTRRRGRRFAQIYSDEESADEAPLAKPPSGGGASTEDGKVELRRVETPYTYTRRRGQGKQEEEMKEVEHTAAAVPIGDPVRVTGRRGKNPRKHYASFAYNGLTFDLEDSVLVTPEKTTEKPYAAIIKDITETEGSLTVTGQWFYRPEDAEIGESKFCIARDTRELFYSFHVDDVPAESVMHRCIVHFIPQNKQFPARKKHPGFIVQKVYGAIEKKLWNLTDKEFEENMQQEISILLKKTTEHIGDLPDLEPLYKKGVHPTDVTRDPPVGKPENLETAEAPATSKLKNYAILARYNAVTKEESRDRWLDKLLESVPLAWSKEIAARMLHTDPSAATKGSSNLSSTKIIASDDNEKSYGLDDVVPIIVALERSAYEALGTDPGKYNQKLRHLWYNIKNSSKLRRRLMEKKLDPQVLLTMSPDELKLECTSCGHTWFSSSSDAISSLSADGPRTATVAGNVASGATAAAARAASLEKKKQRAKSRSKFIRAEAKSSKLQGIPEDNSV